MTEIKEKLKDGWNNVLKGLGGKRDAAQPSKLVIK